MPLRPIAALCLLVLAGCASITEGTEQTLIIPVYPKEARCSVMRNDVELGTITGTQQTITVGKGAKDILVNCSAPGYLPKVARLVSTTQTAGMMSVLFLDFGITDMVTGAMWKYPSSSSISLERDQGPPPVAGTTPAMRPAALAIPVVATSPEVIAPKAETRPTGKDAYVAERLARDMKCTGNDTLAALIGRGPGYESYSLQCTNGETLVIRCEMGNCRALK